MSNNIVTPVVTSVNKAQGYINPHVNPVTAHGVDCVSHNNSVRLVPDLSAAAFRTKQTKEYALWVCLRSLDYKGKGFIGFESAIEGLRQVFGYGEKTISRTLNHDGGVFWHRIASKRGTTIKIEGIKNVCLTLNTRLFNTIRFYEVPAEKFQSLRMRRLAMWASIHKPKGMKANPISRESLSDYTGVQRRTQQLYDKDAEIKKTPNFRPDNPDQKRSPNSYHNKSEPKPNGMLKKLRREIKQSLVNDEALSLEPRRYFSNTRQMLKTKNRVDICYILVRSDKRQVKGRLEWKPVLSMGI